MQSLKSIGNVFKYLIVLFCICIAFDAVAEIPMVTFNIDKFEVNGESPLTQSEIESVLEAFKGEHHGLDGLLAAVDALESALADAGFPFHKVSLPQQTLTNGVVKLELVNFEIDKVQVKGNQFYSVDNILRSLPDVQQGKPPVPTLIAENLRFANLHQDKQVKVSFKDSEASGKVDAQIEVEDQKPWHLFTTINNTGTDATGNSRLTIGYQHNNIGDLDHSLTLTYTLSPEKISAVRQYGINYHIPIYHHAAELDVIYSDSDVDSGTVASVFDVKGKGKVLGLQFKKHLPKVDTYTHSVQLGIMDQLFISDVRFGALPLGNDVRSRPITLKYEGLYQEKLWQFGFHIDAVSNLSGGGHNNNASYAAARTNASDHWYKFTYGANAQYQLQNNWLILGRLEGQWTKDVLIPGEQIALGGSSSVRGFEESATSGDRGAYYNLELWLPAFTSQISGLMFLDGGYRRLNVVQAGEVKTDSIESIGFGIQWNINTSMSLQADYARITDGFGANNPTGNNKLHFNLLYRF